MSSVNRPYVDVVVPFFGSDDELLALVGAMSRIELRAGDTLTIVDNRPTAIPSDDPLIVAAPEIQSSYHARNRGAARGESPWLVFVDADVKPRPDLLDRYFDPLPADGTALLEGVVQSAGPVHGRIARYGALRKHVSNEHVQHTGFEYAQTANVAIRRRVFEDLGGFPDDLFSGGDADICFRIRDSGWESETRSEAVGDHPPRASLKAMMSQYRRYGTGTEWLSTVYPGFGAPPATLRAAVQLCITPITVPFARIRGGSDAALTTAIDPLVRIAFERGRFSPNLSNPTRSQTVVHVAGVAGRRLRHHLDRLVRRA